jgi:hypothetical protein
MTPKQEIEAMLGEMFPSFEIAAFRYELARRVAPEGVPPYVMLSELDIHTVNHHFRHTGKPWTAVNHNGKPFPRQSGIIFDSVEWNLLASDAALQKEFLMRIDMVRAARNIEKPRKNSKNNNKGASWRKLELIDDGNNLDDSDRSARSKAVKEAESLQHLLLPALEEIRRNHEFLERNPDPHYSNKPFRFRVC